MKTVAILLLLCPGGCFSQTEHVAASAASTTHAHLASRCKGGCAKPIQAAPPSIAEKIDEAVRLFAPAIAFEVAGYHIDTAGAVLVDVDLGGGSDQAYEICNEVKRSIDLEQIVLSPTANVAIPGAIQALASC